MVALFLSSTSKHVEQLASSIESGNAHNIETQAHTIKGAAANMSAREITSAAGSDCRSGPAGTTG